MAPHLWLSFQEIVYETNAADVFAAGNNSETRRRQGVHKESYAGFQRIHHSILALRSLLWIYAC